MNICLDFAIVGGVKGGDLQDFKCWKLCVFVSVAVHTCTCQIHCARVIEKGGEES